jgi:PilZ domain.
MARFCRIFARNPGRQRRCQFTLTPHFTRRALPQEIKLRKSLPLCGEISMHDRRESVRNKVMLGGIAEIGEPGTTRDCIVRNISDRGATIEFSNVAGLPKEQLSLRIARKGRSFMARVIWWRDNFVGVAFRAESPVEPVSDLEERLRKSEIKKRQLQRKIDDLLGHR